MKGVTTMKALACLLFLIFSANTFAQIDSVIVETYYVADANDNLDTDGGTEIPTGAKTYRLFLDMSPGWELESVFGNGDHDMIFATSTYFWNNEDRGETTGDAINDSRLDENTVALDSWLSFGGASDAHIGIMKSEDGDGSIVGGVNNDGGDTGIAGGLLVNNDAAMCGEALTATDGLVSGTPNLTATIGDLTAQMGSLLADGNTEASGESIVSNNGSFFILGGSAGYGTENRILLAQITTDGDFSFQLSVRLKSPAGGFEQFVPSNPQALAAAISGVEIVNSGLTFSSIGYSSCAVAGCTLATACNYNAAATTDDGSCVSATGCDTCSGETDGTGTVVDNPEVGDACDDMDATTLGDVYTACGVCEGTAVSGCMTATACNYNAAATVDDGTCVSATGCDTCSGETDGTGTVIDNPEVGDACDDMDATTVGDVYTACGVCEGTTVPGCMTATACNYNAAATVDDGTCVSATGCDTCSGETDGTGTVIDNPEVGEACDDMDPNTINDVIQANCACAGTGAINGCMTATACNYNANANVDDGSCVFATGCDACSGETDGTGTVIDNPEVGDACDDLDATTENDVYTDCFTCAGTAITGCTDSAANNYNANAATDDGSCMYDVTLNVDMNCFDGADTNIDHDGAGNPGSGSFTVPAVEGPSFGWCGSCVTMTDADADGIWTVTVSVPAGNFEYKYAHDSFAGQEQLVDDMVGGASCAPVTDFSGFANRQISVPAVTVTNDVYGSCGSCLPGCDDIGACNYNAAATSDDGSCIYATGCDTCSGETDGTGTVVDNPEVGESCDDNDPNTSNDIVQANCACVGTGIVNGCLDMNACNYNANANTDDASCIYATGCDTCSGETDGTGTVVDNPEIGESCDDNDATTANDIIQGDCSCAGTPLVFGCTDADAVNYDAAADSDDGSCLFNITFSVDMNCYDGNNSDIETAAPYAGAGVPGVSGSFCGWCNDIVMTDADMDGVWTVDVALPNGTYEYKYMVDGFAGQEQLLDNDGESCVAVVAAPFANRGLTVAGDSSTESGVYGGCAVCDPNADTGCTDSAANNYDMTATTDDGSCTYDVTLNVDMNCFDGTDSNIELGGDGTFTIPAVESGTFGWCGSCVTMTDADADGIWSVTVSLPAGAFEYKYAHDSWAGQEQLIDNAGEACVGNTDFYGFANRVITVPATLSTSDVYGTCAACVPGCTDINASNYNAMATFDDGSCLFGATPCDNATAVMLTEFGGAVGYIQDDLASGISETTSCGTDLTRWFSFVAQSANDVIHAGVHPALPSYDATLDVSIEVFDACGGNSLGCFDNYGAGSLERVVVGTLIPGNTYYYAVQGASGVAFSTTVKTFAPHMLRAPFCGVSTYAYTDVIQAQRDDINEIYAFQGVLVNGYAFEFSQAGTVVATVYQPATDGFYIQLSEVPGISPGQVYDVRTAHRVMYQSNGAPASYWGEFGSPCVIGLDADIQDVEVESEFCGGMYTYPSSQVILSTIAAGADAYQWRFTGGAGTFEYLHDNYGVVMHPTDLAMLPSGTYSVAVRAEVGGVWGDYSMECPITVNNVMPIASPDFVSAKNLSVVPGVNIYPNPNFGDVFRVSVDELTDENQKVLINVMDLSGKVIFTEQFSNQGAEFSRVITLDSKLNSGMYIVSITANDVMITEKMVVE